MAKSIIYDEEARKALKAGVDIIADAIKNNYETKILNYCTSADVTKDKSRVVGYTSALIGK